MVRLSRGLTALALALLVLAAPAMAQTMRAPLPPERPFDLDLATGPGQPAIVVSAQPEPGAAVPGPTLAQPDDDEGPEWPQRTPGQAEEEPAFDPEEKPERPGISTDPGTSIVCLPPVLKSVLGKIAAKFGAVKVTSSWRPPWRARRGSYHKRCEAMDFRVPGVRPRIVLDYARALPEVGGHKVYWNGLIHIDTGPRRPW
ncbi:YcbK family protein [Bosea sp. (in: a-proteobacteria)]|uniref:YcbK family protein n=1 Tax=Bosea sp. (in: a-proteobacteria) TaxID=1871050 RepID=UPI002FCAE416